MAIEFPPNDMESFYAFLGERLGNGCDRLTPEESVQEFRKYQDEISRLRSKLTTSHKQFVDGEAKVLDSDALMERVRTRVAQQGNTD